MNAATDDDERAVAQKHGPGYMRVMAPDDATNLNPAGPDEIARIYDRINSAPPNSLGAAIRDNAGQLLLWLVQSWGASGYNSIELWVNERAKMDPEDLFWQVMKVAIDEYKLSTL